MKALHNSTLSKLESWVACVHCVTALTSCGVTLTKGKMWRHQHESASAGAPTRVEGASNCTCAAALRFLHQRTFYWETIATSTRLLYTTIGKFNSHAWLHQTRCILLSNHLHNALAQSMTRCTSVVVFVKHRIASSVI